MTEKLNAERMTRSLNGFDEMAIRKAFGASFDVLEGTLNPRALLFVQFRRDGAKDGEAFKAAMEATIGELEERFEAPDAEGNEGGSTSIPTTNETGPTPTS